VEEFDQLVKYLRDYIKSKEEQIKVNLLKNMDEEATRLNRAEYFTLEQFSHVFEEKVKRIKQGEELDDD
jgi:hypothetical protein